MKQLVLTPCFAFLCVLETSDESINDCGGDGITAKCVVCCNKTYKFYPHFHSSACDQTPLSVTLVSGDGKPMMEVLAEERCPVCASEMCHSCSNPKPHGFLWLWGWEEEVSFISYGRQDT